MCVYEAEAAAFFRDGIIFFLLPFPHLFFFRGKRSRREEFSGGWIFSPLFSRSRVKQSCRRKVAVAALVGPRRRAVETADTANKQGFSFLSFLFLFLGCLRPDHLSCFFTLPPPFLTHTLSLSLSLSQAAVYHFPPQGPKTGKVSWNCDFF